MRIGYLIVLLLYVLMIVSAGAVKNQETEISNYLTILAEANPAKESLLKARDPFDGSYGSWEKLISKQEENYPAILTISIDSNRFNPDFVLEKNLSSGNNRTARDYIAETNYFTKLIDTSLMKNQYLSRGHNENITDMNQPIYGSSSTISTVNSDLRYIYENDIDISRQRKKDLVDGENQIYLSYLDHNSLKRQNEMRQVAHLVGAVDSYLTPETESPENLKRSTLFIDQNKTNSDSDLYERLSTFETGKEQTGKQALSADTIAEDNSIKIQNSIYSRLFDPNLIEEKSKLPPQSVRSAGSLVNTPDRVEGLDILVRDYHNTPLKSINSGRIDDNMYRPGKLPSSGHRENTEQNYAVVVGIDEYSDRMDLHTCDNDARSVADLLKSLGYKVILLSDNAATKPTKHNILNVALEDANLKKSKGNIIFYFSGHGEKDSDGNFYLIPKDANGNRTSYISDYELKQYIKDLKNLAVIVDACNGGGFSNAIGEGQLIIASSKDNEPSNEEWTGSFSIFTKNLCDAIREQSYKGDKIHLQECFNEAYNDTVRWSRMHLMSQNPVLIDLTRKEYNLR